LKTDLPAEALAKEGNVDDIKVKTKELSELMQKIGTELYKNHPQGGPQPTPPNPENEVNEKSEDEKPQADEGEVKEKK